MLFTELLRKHDLCDAANIFEEECIEENVLNNLTEQMLERIGVKQLGKRLKIMNLLAEHLKDNDSSQSEDLDTSSSSCSTSSSSLDVNLKSESSKEQNEELPMVLPYPNYSADIVKAEKDGDILPVRSKIIRQSANFYLALKYNLRPEYDRICQHLIERFPVLQDSYVYAGAMHKHSRLKKDLSQSVRNHKRLKPTKSPITVPNVIIENVAHANEEELPDLKKELSKEVAKIRINETHLGYLAEELAPHFRAYISKPRVLNEILDDFPFLNTPIMILSLCGKMLSPKIDFGNVTVKNLTSLYDAIAKVTLVDDGDDEDDMEEPGEDQILAALQFAENQVKGKSDKSIFCDLAEMPKTPCIVLCHNATKLEQTLIAIDGQIFVDTRRPDVILALQLWLAAHYVFNIEYGKHNRAFALFLEDTVLKANGIYSMQSAVKRRRVARSAKTEELYRRIKAVGFEF